MTRREKILRGWIENTETEIDNTNATHADYYYLVKSLRKEIPVILKQADEIKDGPSEEDKRRYKRFKSILLDQKDRLTWREAKELFRLVSRSWGIE